MYKQLATLLLSHFAAVGIFAQSTTTNNQELNPNRPKTPYLSPAEQLETLKLKEGYSLELVVADPVVKEPVVTVFDGNGNMYVAEMRTYMQDINNSNKYQPISRVSMHQDTDGDGTYDKHTVFADNLLLPRIILPLDRRIIIGETNTLDLYSYEDTDGDGVADKKELWFKGGPRGGNLEHQPSGLIWAMDNWLYTTYNSYRLRFTNNKVIKEKIPVNGGQWGLTQDNDGKPWFVNGGGERGPVNFQWPVVYGTSKVPGQFVGDFKAVWPIDNIPDTQGGLKRLRDDNTLNHFTSTCGQTIFRGDRLPQDIRGNLFFAEPVGRLLRRAVVETKDGLSYLSNPYEKEKSEFILTKDPNFRVVNTATAPDGTLYICDMYRGIIQEGHWVGKGSYLRGVVQEYRLDENFGKGRVWRLRHKDFKPGPQPRMLEETPAQLVNHLSHANGWWRDTAQKLLILKGDKTVVPALKHLVAKGPTVESKLHALWTLEGLGSLDKALVSAAMEDREPRVRATAIRVGETLYKNGDKSLTQLIFALLEDEEPTVKMQAMLTAKYLDLDEWKSKIDQLAKNDRADGVLQVRSSLLKTPAKSHAAKKFNKHESKIISAGEDIYMQLCASCHGTDAKGQKSGPLMMAPPLAGSPRINANKEVSISILMHGLSGKVDGKEYPGGMMAPMGSNGDKWIADVLSYVRTHFDNNSSLVSEQDVTRVRTKNKNRQATWTLEELGKLYPLPITNKQDWRLSASHNRHKLKYAVDDSLNTRYDTGSHQNKGMWLQVELPTVKEVHGVSFDATASVEDYPKGYLLEFSKDGKNWQSMKAGTGDNKLTIMTKPTLAKFIKMTLTEQKKGKFWSIHDLNILAK